MDFEKDENKRNDWREDDRQDNKPFDFDAFLEPEEEIGDHVTDVLDGKDLLHEDAFDEFAPDYIPSRRTSDGERGRHEAPGSENFREEFRKEEPPRQPPVRPTRPFDPNDPRYAAPERPKVVVAQPRRKVYVTPPGGEDFDRYDRDEPPRRQGMGEGAKWVIAVLIAVAIIGGLLIALFSGPSGSDNAEPSPSPTGGLGLSLMTDRPVETIPHIWDTPAATAEATPTPTPTAPPAETHAITVTAGAGGSISPSGTVAVEDGGSVSFTITPNSGYEISQVLVDGESVSIGSSYSFNNVTKDHTIYAVFQASATPTPPPTATPTPTPPPQATDDNYDDTPPYEPDGPEYVE